MVNANNNELVMWTLSPLNSFMDGLLEQEITLDYFSPHKTKFNRKFNTSAFQNQFLKENEAFESC